MKLRYLLPLLAAVTLVPCGAAQTAESPAQLRRDLNAVLQQRDALIEQTAQANRERDRIQTERDAALAEAKSLKDRLASTTPSGAASPLEQALKTAEMKADMTVRAFAIKEEEASRAVQAAGVAAQKQAGAEQARESALAETARLTTERDAARKSEAAALAAKAQMQNDLYAAQIRIDNLMRALGARGGSLALPPPATPTPVATEQPAPDEARESKAAEAGPRTHTVGEGETLSLLSFKYYGTPNKWDKIFEANRDKLKNPDMVRPGMLLKIP